MRFCLIISALLIGLCVCVTASARAQERTIKLVKWPHEPLEITRLEVHGKVISYNQSFNAEGDDWFRGLAVSVKNVSSQTIHFIDLGLTFEPSGGGDLPSRDHLLYGCQPRLSSEADAPKCDQPPLKPNETATLVLKDYEGTRRFLDETGKPQNINGFEVSIGEVLFADGRMWSGGQILKQDPNNPNRWLPEKRQSNENQAEPHNGLHPTRDTTALMKSISRGGG